MAVSRSLRDTFLMTGRGAAALQRRVIAIGTKAGGTKPLQLRRFFKQTFEDKGPCLKEAASFSSPIRNQRSTIFLIRVH